MLIRLSNTPKDYAWGSRSLIAALEGRGVSTTPEAEVWFGAHPGGPSVIEDGSGRALDAWLAEGHDGAPARLPYLLKLLAAASPLSIQVHPSKAQAEEGFAAESGLAADAPERNYRDDNHKPELLVALSDTFEALCGLRPLAETRRLVESLGDGVGAAALRARLEQDGDEEEVLRTVIAWLLSGSADLEVASLVDSAALATSTEFSSSLNAVRRIASVYPGDPGAVVAMLMNYVMLGRGEAVFLRAGMLHAYLSGLGVEVMAASDNVLRGGLTAKHIDVDELLRVLEARPGVVPVMLPQSTDDASRGVEAFAPGVEDFELLRARLAADAVAHVSLRGAAIVLVTGGRVEVHGEHSSQSQSLTPGQALFATADESSLRLSGEGEAFIAQPGAPLPR